MSCLGVMAIFKNGFHYGISCVCVCMFICMWAYVHVRGHMYIESTSSIIPKSHPLGFNCDNVLWPGLPDCARLAGGALQGAARLCLPTAGTASMQFQVWFYFNFFLECGHGGCAQVLMCTWEARYQLSPQWLIFIINLTVLRFPCL